MQGSLPEYYLREEGIPQRPPQGGCCTPMVPWSTLAVCSDSGCEQRGQAARPGDPGTAGRIKRGREVRATARGAQW